MGFVTDSDEYNAVVNLLFISAPLSASPLSRMLPMSCSVAVGAPAATEEGVPNWLRGPAQEFHLQLVIDGTATATAMGRLMPRVARSFGR